MSVKVGFIGLGTMGLPMAKIIYQTNGQLLVSDLVEKPKEEMRELGAEIAVDNKQVAQSCDVIFLSLPTVRVVESVVKELIAEGKAGQYIVDTSTIGYKLSVDLGKQAKDRGIEYVDAPVSGGAGRAAVGDLSVIIGAEKEELDKAGISTMIDAISRQAHYTGRRGSGIALKIINNMLSKSILFADGEAVVLAEHMGIPFDALYEVIQSSSSQNEIFRIKKEHIRDHSYGPANKSYSPITMSLKDLKAARELSDELGLANFGCNNTIQWYEIGMQRGYEKMDSSSIVELLREIQPVKKDD